MGRSTLSLLVFCITFFSSCFLLLLLPFRTHQSVIILLATSPTRNGCCAVNSQSVGRVGGTVVKANGLISIAHFVMRHSLTFGRFSGNVFTNSVL